jgi:phosphopantetheinyl transferase (holo-ACP synthase)
VTRFLKIQDQLTSLASLLLKSKAYHESLQERRIMEHGESSSDDSNVAYDRSESLPVTSLPRTKNQKPFIPQCCDETNVDTKSASRETHTLSISHQFPFTGSVRLKITSLSQDHGFDLAVGLDIVVWDADSNPFGYNRSNVMEEFVSCFQESFTSDEWDEITGSELNNSKTPSSSFSFYEFYIRWSMKEAYTKALGYGMILDFKSFQMQPTPSTLTDCNHKSWFQNLGGQKLLLAENVHTGTHPNYLHRIVSVEHLTPNTRWKPNFATNIEQFHFFFLPLRGGPQEESVNPARNIDSRLPSFSLACICVGPCSFQQSDSLCQDLNATIDETEISFDDLSSWHDSLVLQGCPRGTLSAPAEDSDLS